MGLAFWLVPSAASVPTLKREMHALRAANPDAPDFEPHATLLAGIQPDQQGQGEHDHSSLMATAKNAVEQWRKQGNTGTLTCRLEDVTTRGFYFQCILIALHKHPNLLSLNSHMRTSFGLTTQPPFFPHLSLLYSSIDAEEANRQIQTMHQKRIFTRLPDSQGIAFAGLTEVEFVAIDLVDCNGPPDQWKRLDTIPLTS